MAFTANQILAALPKNVLQEVGLPAVFCGLKPHFLGYAKDTATVDRMLLAKRMSATYISRAVVKGQILYLAHNGQR